MSPADLKEMDKVGGWKGVGEYTKERFPAKFCFLIISSRHYLLPCPKF